MSIGKYTLGYKRHWKVCNLWDLKEMPGSCLTGWRTKREAEGIKPADHPALAGGVGKVGGWFQSSHFYMSPWKLSREHHLTAGQGDTLWSTFQMPLKGRGGEKWRSYDSKVTMGTGKVQATPQRRAWPSPPQSEGWMDDCHGQHRSPHLHGTTITRGCVQICVCVCVCI